MTQPNKQKFLDELYQLERTIQNFLFKLGNEGLISAPQYEELYQSVHKIEREIDAHIRRTTTL